MIYDWFKTDAHMRQMYGYQDLSAHTWHGDEQMEAWLAQWDYICANLEDNIGEKTLRDIMQGHM